MIRKTLPLVFFLILAIPWSAHARKKKPVTCPWRTDELSWVDVRGRSVVIDGEVYKVGSTEEEEAFAEQLKACTNSTTVEHFEKWRAMRFAVPLCALTGPVTSGITWLILPIVSIDAPIQKNKMERSIRSHMTIPLTKNENTILRTSLEFQEGQSARAAYTYLQSKATGNEDGQAMAYLMMAELHDQVHGADPIKERDLAQQSRETIAGDTQRAFAEYVEAALSSKQRAADVFAWDRAQTTGTVESYKRYVHDFPKGVYIDQATASVHAAEIDRNADRLSTEGSIDQIEAFIKDVPDCTQRDALEQRLIALSTPQASTEDYGSYIRRFSGDSHEARQRHLQFAYEAIFATIDEDNAEDVWSFLRQYPDAGECREKAEQLILSPYCPSIEECTEDQLVAFINRYERCDTCAIVLAAWRELYATYKRTRRTWLFLDEHPDTPVRVEVEGDIAQLEANIEQARGMILGLAKVHERATLQANEDFIFGMALVSLKYPAFPNDVNQQIEEGEQLREQAYDLLRRNPYMLTDPAIVDLMNMNPEFARKAELIAGPGLNELEGTEERLVQGVRGNPTLLEMSEMKKLKGARPNLWTRLEQAAAAGRSDEADFERAIEQDPSLYDLPDVHTIVEDRPDLAQRYKQAAERGRRAAASRSQSSSDYLAWDGTYEVANQYRSPFDANEYVYRVRCGGMVGGTAITLRGGKYWEGYHSYSSLGEASLDWCSKVQ